MTIGPAGAPYLTRMVLSCCAADALPVKVGLTGDVPPNLRPDVWIDIVGTYSPRQTKAELNGGPIPYIAIVESHHIKAPAEPYEV